MMMCANGTTRNHMLTIYLLCERTNIFMEEFVSYMLLSQSTDITDDGGGGSGGRDDNDQRLNCVSAAAVFPVQ